MRYFENKQTAWGLGFLLTALIVFVIRSLAENKNSISICDSLFLVSEVALFVLCSVHVVGLVKKRWMEHRTLAALKIGWGAYQSLIAVVTLWGLYASEYFETYQTAGSIIWIFGFQALILPEICNFTRAGIGRVKYK